MEPLNDPKEIRKHLTNVRYRGLRVDGKELNRSSISTTAAMVNNIFSLAEAQGYSGEDAMTMLAYHALLQNEKLMDMQLEFLQTSPAKIVLSP